VRDGRPCTATVTFQTRPPSRAECYTRTELCAICAGRVVLLLQAIDEPRASVYAQAEVVAVLRAAGDAERALLCATCNHVLSAHMRGHCAVQDCRCPAYS
jgi:hypothetical protein